MGDTVDTADEAEEGSLTWRREQFARDFGLVLHAHGSLDVVAVDT